MRRAQANRPSNGDTMTTRKRSRASAKSAGTRHETVIARYLTTHVDDRIERRARNGGKDRGDLSGMRLGPSLGGGRVVAELKNTARINLAGWAAEAELERGNDDALVGLVISKRHGVSDPGAQWVHMTVRDLIALLTGRRPEETS